MRQQNNKTETIMDTLNKINKQLKRCNSSDDTYFPLKESSFDENGNRKARMKAVNSAVHVAYGMGIDTMMVDTNFCTEGNRLDTFEVFCVYKRKHNGQVYKTMEIALEFTKKTGKLVNEYVLSEDN